jgi:hypothetical protein
MTKPFPAYSKRGWVLRPAPGADARLANLKYFSEQRHRVKPPESTAHIVSDRLSKETFTRRESFPSHPHL